MLPMQIYNHEGTFSRLAFDVDIVQNPGYLFNRLTILWAQEPKTTHGHNFYQHITRAEPQARTTCPVDIAQV